jgi:hypothetical protein
MEGFYSYSEVGSIGKGVLASSAGVTGTIHIVPVRVRRKCKGAPILSGGYWRR